MVNLQREREREREREVGGGGGETEDRRYMYKGKSEMVERGNWGGTFSTSSAFSDITLSSKAQSSQPT